MGEKLLLQGLFLHGKRLFNALEEFPVKRGGLKCLTRLLAQVNDVVFKSLDLEVVSLLATSWLKLREHLQDEGVVSIH
jgi:hypothetical protein